MKLNIKPISFDDDTLQGHHTTLHQANGWQKVLAKS